MKSVSEAEVRETVLRVLGNVAPEADASSIDPEADLRDQIDLDSVDFLNFVIGLHRELGVDIPDADVPKLRTLRGCVAYLMARARDAVSAG
ncbi:MAG TPA: acyl carrier protein [candidate division Zixibacteria bacterium]|nr:acyl carrier protein [candidate division Zixibacteria bacterium]